jgi:hypothetical protein
MTDRTELLARALDLRLSLGAAGWTHKQQVVADLVAALRATEARVAELETALREAVDWMDDPAEDSEPLVQRWRALVSSPDPTPEPVDRYEAYAMDAEGYTAPLPDDDVDAEASAKEELFESAGWCGHGHQETEI